MSPEFLEMGGGTTVLNIRGLGINAELKLNTDVEDIEKNQSYSGTLKLRDRKKSSKQNKITLLNNFDIWQQYRIYSFMNDYADYWFFMLKSDDENDKFNKIIIRVPNTIKEIITNPQFVISNKKLTEDFGIRIYQLTNEKIYISIYSYTTNTFLEEYEIEIFSSDEKTSKLIKEEDIPGDNTGDNTGNETGNETIKKYLCYPTPKKINEDPEYYYRVYFDQSFTYYAFYDKRLGGFNCFHFRDSAGNVYITDMYYSTTYYTFNVSNYRNPEDNTVISRGERVIIKEIKFINNKQIPILENGVKLCLEISVETADERDGDKDKNGIEDIKEKQHDNFFEHDSKYQTIYMRLLKSLSSTEEPKVKGSAMVIDTRDNTYYRTRLDLNSNSVSIESYDPTNDDKFNKDFDQYGYLKEGHLPNYCINLCK